MCSYRFMASLLVLAACETPSAQPGAVAAGSIVIDGSTTLNPMLVETAKVYGAARVEVRQSSSGDGIKRFIAGSIDMAAVSRAPKDAEYAAAAKAHRQLVSRQRRRRRPRRHRAPDESPD